MPSKNDEAGENLKFFICLQRTSENSLIVAITIPLRSIHQFPMLYMDFSHSLEEEQTLKWDNIIAKKTKTKKHTKPEESMRTT